MWGEIVEPAKKTQPVFPEEEKDGGKLESPVKAETPYQRYTINKPVDPRQQRHDTPVSSKVTLVIFYLPLHHPLIVLHRFPLAFGSVRESG